MPLALFIVFLVILAPLTFYCFWYSFTRLNRKEEDTNKKGFKKTIYLYSGKLIFLIAFCLALSLIAMISLYIK